MYLVDLAGSERLSKTGAQGMRLEEAKKISLSLFTLRMVLNALAFKKSHVPFLDSKLTRILQNSLGGNSLSLFIVNISPSAYFYQETLNSLIYGDITRKIINNAEINQDPTCKIIAGFQKEIENLKISSHEEKETLLEEIKKREIEINNLRELIEKPLPKLDQNDQEYLRIRKQEFIDSVRNELDFSSVELEILKSNFNEFEKMLTENETINEDMFKLLKKLEEKNIYQEYRIYDLVQNMQNEKENYITLLENSHLNKNDINAQLMNSFLLITEKSNDDILKHKNFVDKKLSNNKISTLTTTSICAIL